MQKPKPSQAGWARLAFAFMLMAGLIAACGNNETPGGDTDPTGEVITVATGTPTVTDAEPPQPPTATIPGVTPSVTEEPAQ